MNKWRFVIEVCSSKQSLHNYHPMKSHAKTNFQITQILWIHFIQTAKPTTTIVYIDSSKFHLFAFIIENTIFTVCIDDKCVHTSCVYKNNFRVLFSFFFIFSFVFFIFKTLAQIQLHYNFHRNTSKRDKNEWEEWKKCYLIWLKLRKKMNFTLER